MTIDDVITGILAREKGFVNKPSDKGGPTNMGITAATLGRYRKLGRPATVDEVRTLQEPEARAIYFGMYVVEPGFEGLPEWLLPIVVDDGVLSGQGTAARTLQRALGVKADGVIGPITRKAIEVADRTRVLHALVGARIVRYVRIVEEDITQLEFLEGWCTRALGFLA